MVGWSKAMLFSLISQWGWKLKTETNETVNKVNFVCSNRWSWAFTINHTIKRFYPLHVNIDIDIVNIDVVNIDAVNIDVVNIDSQYIVQQIIMPWRKHQSDQAKPVCSCFCLCLISIVYPPKQEEQANVRRIIHLFCNNLVVHSTKSCVVLCWVVQSYLSLLL